MAVGPPGVSVHFLEFLQHLSLYRHSLLCTYCTNSRSRGLLRIIKEKTQAKNKRQFSNPWRPKCSEGSCSGHEKLSGRCRALNATVSMFDNFVWLSRTCVPGGVHSKKSIRTSLFLSDCARQRTRSTRFHTQRLSGSSFPWTLEWQSLTLLFSMRKVAAQDWSACESEV